MTSTKYSILAFTIVTQLASADELKEQFFREAPAGWKSLRQSAEQVVGAGRLETKDYNLGSLMQKLTTEWRFKRNGEWILWEKNVLGERGGLSVGSRNSAYAFVLQRKSQDQPWLLGQVGNDENQMMRIHELAHLMGFLMYLQAPWSIVGRFPMDETISDPTFALRSITAEKGGLVRVEFESAIQLIEPQQPPLTLRGGIMIFDPATSWAIRECDARVDPGRRTQFSLDYDQGQLRKLTGKMEMGTFRNESVFEFTELEHRESPESDFTLSAYGFKEPTWLEKPPRPTRWWLWGTLGSGALLVLGIALWWRKR